MQILNPLVSVSCSWWWFFLSFIHWPPWKDPPSGLPQHFPHLHRAVTPLLKCRNKSTIARLRGPSLWSNDMSPSSTLIITPISLYLNCQILEMEARVAALGTQRDLCFFICLPFHHARHSQNNRNFLLSIFPLKCHHYHFNVNLCRLICNSFTLKAKVNEMSNKIIHSILAILKPFPCFPSYYQIHSLVVASCKNWCMVSFLYTCPICSKPLKPALSCVRWGSIFHHIIHMITHTLPS